MSEDVMMPPEHHGPSHYYGDTVRILFVVAAAVLFLSQFIERPFLTTNATLIAIVLLIVAAGLTNPVQAWIHWANVALAGVLLILFGSIAIARFHETGDLFGSTGLVFALVLIFLVALYSGIRTLRGVLMRGAPTIE